MSAAYRGAAQRICFFVSFYCGSIHVYSTPLRGIYRIGNEIRKVVPRFGAL